MRRLFIAVCLPLLLGGCEIEVPQAESDSQASASDAAAWQPPESSGEPEPVQENFANVPSALDVLARAAADDDKRQLMAAYTWLCKQGPGAVEPVVATMNDTSIPMETRRHACRVLGHLGPGAADPLIAASNSDELALKLRAIETMPVVEPPQETIVNRLTVLLDDPNQQVQNSAIRSLGQIGPAARAAADKLLALRDSDLNETTRHEAGKSLKLVRPIRTFND